MSNRINVERIREDFPITKKYVYLDNAGLSPLPVQVIEAIKEFCEECSLVGAINYYTWLDNLDEVRSLFGKLINADAAEIALTHNTSEGINMVANMLDWRKGDNVIINDLEFLSNVWPWMKQKRRGVEVRVIKNKHGSIDILDIEKEIDKNTKVISVSHVEWLNGFKHDLEALGKLANEHGIYLVVDAIQSVGVLQVDVKKFKVDFLSCGGHKWLLSPLGTGFFYCRKELISEFEPPYLGLLGDKDPSDYSFREFHPSNTARRFMHGNINFAGFYGAKAGLEYIHRIGIENIEQRAIQLTDLLIQLLQDLDVTFLCPLEKRHRSSIVTFHLEKVDEVLRALEKKKIIVAKRIGGLRVSPNFYNTETEIRKLVEVVVGFLK